MNKPRHFKHIVIPEVSPSSLNDRVLKKIEIFASSLATARNITEVERRIEREFDIPTGTQRRWKTQLRKLYGLPPRSRLISVVNHPQFTKAVEYTVARKSRSDRAVLRTAKHLVVASADPKTRIPVEQFLLSAYYEEGMNAAASFRRVLYECEAGRVLKLPNGDRCSPEGLPSIQSVRRFLRKKMGALKGDRSGIPRSGQKLASGGDSPSLVELKQKVEKDADVAVDCCKRVHKTLGTKHREIVYHRALRKELELCSVSFKDEMEFDIEYRGTIVGKDRVDFVIGSGLLLEIKAKKALLPEDSDQARRYLRNLKRRVCLLVNFGRRTLQIKKFRNNPTP